MRAGAIASMEPATDAERLLLSLELFGMRFGLDRMRRLLTALGSPQERFGAVHVVGTNGKSSTVRMTAAILRRHGLRTGAYLSPHLVAFAERVRVDDADVSGAEFAARGRSARRPPPRRSTGRAAPDDHVTQFELLTAAAFDHFARAGVDVAVVEAGLGGRYDATNVLQSQVAVLTNVGLEHTRWLGPDGRRHRRRRSSTSSSPAPTLVDRRAACTPTRARWPRQTARERGADAGRRARRPRRRRWRSWPAARSSGATSPWRSRRRAPTWRRSAASWTRRPSSPPRPPRSSRAASRSSARRPDDRAGRRPQPRRPGRAGRGAAGVRRRPPPRRLPGGARRQGRDRDAARRCCRSATRSSPPARRRRARCRPPRWRRSATSSASPARSRSWGRPAPRWQRARALAGPDGVALATGSIYLIADLLRPAGAARSTL